MRNKRTSKIDLFPSLFVGALLLVAPIASASAAVTTEPKTDRPGSDYAGYDLPAADPALCRNACEDDAKCKAYTYVKPGVQGPAARCYLKDPVPAAQANTCCVSGVKSATRVLRAPPPAAPDNRVLSPEARAQGAQPLREFPAEFKYARDDSADLDADFRGKFRRYGIAYDWNEPGPKKLRFRWLNKTQGVASARWEVSTVPFGPARAAGATAKPTADSKSLQTAPSATPQTTPAQAQAQAQASAASTPTLLATGAAPLARLTRSRTRSDAIWSFFEIDLGSFEPFVLKGLVVDPLKTDKTVGGQNPNDVRPNLYVRVVLLGPDGAPVGAESNTINIRFLKIVVGNLKKPKISPSVVDVKQTIAWSAHAWNYQCYAQYARDYELKDPFGSGQVIFSAKRGDPVNLCEKKDTTWYEDVGNFIVGAFESLVDFVKDTVNWAATAYNDVKSAALNGVVSGLKGVTGCGDICQSVVSATLDTGLAMAGVPPSLPDFDELVANLEKGQIDTLVDTMAQAAEAQGVPLNEIPGVKTAIKDQLIELKDDLKSEISKKSNGGGAPLIADLSKQYRPMTVVFRMRNNGPAKSQVTSVCISQSQQTPPPLRSMGYVPACAIVPGLISGGSIPVSIDIDAFDDPKAWESLMPTAADYANFLVYGGVIVKKMNAAQAAQGAWANKYLKSTHSFDVSIGKDRIGGLQCTNGGATCALVQ